MSATQLIDPAIGKIYQNLINQGNDGDIEQVLIQGDDANGQNLTGVGNFSSVTVGTDSLGVGVAAPANAGTAQVNFSLGVGVAPPVGAGGLATSGGIIAGNGLKSATGGFEVLNPLAPSQATPNNEAFGVSSIGDVIIRNTAVDPATQSVFITAANGNMTMTGGLGVGVAPPAAGNIQTAGNIQAAGGLGVGVVPPAAGNIQAAGSLQSAGNITSTGGSIAAQGVGSTVTAAGNLGAPFISLSADGAAVPTIRLTEGSALNGTISVLPAVGAALNSQGYFIIRIVNNNYAVPCYGPLP